MSASAVEPGRRFAARVVRAVVVAIVLVGVGGAGVGPGPVPVGAQEPSGVGAERWAPVTTDPAAPPEVAVSRFWIDPAPAADGSPASVVVDLASASGPGGPPWRVSVSVGDPLGVRTRVSAMAVDQTVSGLVERGDGVRWDELGPGTVAVGDGGRVTVEVPLDEAEADAVVWVQVEATVDGASVTSTSSWFALADLLGTRPGPALGVAPVAAVVADGDAGPVSLPGPRPTLAVVGRGLEVVTTDPVPLDVGGVGVAGVVDTVLVARDSDDGGARTDRVEIDRGTGEVRLVPADGEAVVAEPGTSPWLVSGPSPTDPGAPATVTFDVEALDVALGGPVLERATTAVGVTRTVALDDGRALQAAGVVGTMAWFDTALVAAAPDADAETGAVREATATSTVLIAVVALVVVALVAVVVLARRRRRRGGRDRAAEPSAARASGAGRAPASGAGVGEGPDPLAALFAEVDELSARVDRLTGPDPGPGPDAEPSAGPGPGSEPDPGGGGGVEPGR